MYSNNANIKYLLALFAKISDICEHSMEFKKHLIVVIFIPLGIILILSASLIFLGSDIASRANQINQLRRDLNFRLQATESLSGLRQDTEQVKSYLPVLEVFLPTRDQLISFLSDLNIIAKQSLVEISSSLGEENPKQDTGPGSVNFTITIQGIFDNLINFLKTLENGRYFTKIISLDSINQGDNFKTTLIGHVFSF